MKAVSIAQAGVVPLTDLPEPQVGMGEVAIELAYVGFCGSDLTSFRGLNPLASFPRVPGHEIAGTVAACGEGVEDPPVETVVTVLPYFNCGTCRACRIGKPNAGVNNQTMGVQREGAMTGTVVVPREKLIPVHGLPLRDAALIEPCSVGFHAVSRGEVSSADVVMVLGCGMIGLGAIMGSVRRNATVIAVDLSPAKLEVARKLGATYTVCPADGDLVSQVCALVADGPDVVIEAVGSSTTFLAAVDIVAQCGRVVYIGYTKAPVAYDTKMFITKELDIRGARTHKPVIL